MPPPLFTPGCVQSGASCLCLDFSFSPQITNKDSLVILAYKPRGLSEEKFFFWLKKRQSPLPALIDRSSLN
jgi:hypothetical protein